MDSDSTPATPCRIGHFCYLMQNADWKKSVSPTLSSFRLLLATMAVLRAACFRGDIVSSARLRHKKAQSVAVLPFHCHINCDVRILKSAGPPVGSQHVVP